MKKPVFVLILFLILLSSVSLFAQESKEEPNLFVKTVPIIRVLSHSLGYKVFYYKNGMGMGSFYIPFSWFSDKGGKGEILWGKGPEYPYFSVFWDEGQLHHIKLFLHEDLHHISWGSLIVNAAKAEQDFNITPENFSLDF